MATDFSKPHYVALVLTMDEQAQLQNGNKKNRNLHQSYYHRLKKQNSVLFYGNTLNDTGLYIILQVSSDEHLTEIIDNDPLLKTAAMEIVSITPFFTCI
ncbi:hypothetical protein FW774_12640 [Pedobacter sp. BS3]|uniref:YciI family protein n=1 Tax=Pedobacter sp. BS3 TaxID=2567937 RepID=UPI0011ECC93C|nr:YciI family protein [Pedobacter sp. BS3]TZF83142.1 hypothetical protein FW774_12640 [Pedobacter sp. BS3]